MLKDVVIGARVSMTPAEADQLAGDGAVRLVTCVDGRVVGGVGPVGLVEHLGITDLVEFIDQVKAKREALRTLAATPQDKPQATYSFTRI